MKKIIFLMLLLPTVSFANDHAVGLKYVNWDLEQVLELPFSKWWKKHKSIFGSAKVRDSSNVTKSYEMLVLNYNIMVRYLNRQPNLDIFLEDVRRTLRFYTKNSKQSHFSALYLSGGGGNVKGLKEYMEENLQIKSQVMDPFANLETKDNISIEDPAQYAVATGLAVRKGFEA